MFALELYQCLIALYRLLLSRDKLLCPRGMGTGKKLANSSKKCRWCQEENKGYLSEVTFVHVFLFFLFSFFFLLSFSIPATICSDLESKMPSWKDTIYCVPSWSFDLNQSNKSETLQLTLLQGRLISWRVVPMAVMVFQPCAFFFYCCYSFLRFWPFGLVRVRLFAKNSP